MSAIDSILGFAKNALFYHVTYTENNTKSKAPSCPAIPEISQMS